MKIILERIRDLLLKFLSVKGTLAITSTVIFILNPTSDQALYFASGAWLLFILGREAFKIIALIKGDKNGTSQGPQ